MASSSFWTLFSVGHFALQRNAKGEKFGNRPRYREHHTTHFGSTLWIIYADVFNQATHAHTVRWVECWGVVTGELWTISYACAGRASGSVSISKDLRSRHLCLKNAFDCAAAADLLGVALFFAPFEHPSICEQRGGNSIIKIRIDTSGQRRRWLAGQNEMNKFWGRPQLLGGTLWNQRGIPWLLLRETDSERRNILNTDRGNEIQFLW